MRGPSLVLALFETLCMHACMLGVGKTTDGGTFSVLFQSPASFRWYKSTEISTEVSVAEGRRVFVQESHQNEEIQ
jgi:hypothetical protein